MNPARHPIENASSRGLIQGSVGGVGVSGRSHNFAQGINANSPTLKNHENSKLAIERTSAQYNILTNQSANPSQSQMGLIRVATNNTVNFKEK